MRRRWGADQSDLPSPAELAADEHPFDQGSTQFLCGCSPSFPHVYECPDR